MSAAPNDVLTPSWSWWGKIKQLRRLKNFNLCIQRLKKRQEFFWLMHDCNDEETHHDPRMSWNLKCSRTAFSDEWIIPHQEGFLGQPCNRVGLQNFKVFKKFGATSWWPEMSLFYFFERTFGKDESVHRYWHHWIVMVILVNLNPGHDKSQVCQVEQESDGHFLEQPKCLDLVERKLDHQNICSPEGSWRFYFWMKVCTWIPFHWRSE